jgi:hypothetical protein
MAAKDALDMLDSFPIEVGEVEVWKVVAVADTSGTAVRPLVSGCGCPDYWAFCSITSTIIA